uniref:Transcriptional regulator n=1 Tax=Heterorhabditis bacteriophora TaxID=37862 RepID=A0A1I7WN73_HETBA
MLALESIPKSVIKVEIRNQLYEGSLSRQLWTAIDERGQENFVKLAIKKQLLRMLNNLLTTSNDMLVEDISAPTVLD